MAIAPRLPSRLFPWLVVAMAAGATAQCPLQLQPGFGVPGTDQMVRASTMWDPDGAGPAQPRLVVAGDFTALGSTLANRIAVLDPATGTFAPLGSGLNGPVETVVGMPNGDLVVGGTFSAAGGVPAMWLARWNGTAWSAVAGAFWYYSVNTRPGVHAIAVLPNGDLAVGGEFWEPTSGAYSLVRWNGSAWSGFGSGISGATWAVHALAVLPNGDLAAGGSFTTAGGVAASSVARWDGSTWSALGTGIDGTAFALAVLANGDLAVGGAFSVAGGVPALALARWNGSAWSAFGTGLGAGPSGISVLSLTATSSGDLLAGGLIATAGGVPCGNLARWNGVAWSGFAGGVSGGSGQVRTTAALANGDVVVGGDFFAVGGVTAIDLARWDGAAWSAFGSGIDAAIWAMVGMPNGDLVVAGSFATIGGVIANRIARWNGVAWSPLGAGLGGPVYALQVMPNGDLVAGGQFATAGGAPANNVARWDGTSWSPLGAGVTGPTAAFVAVRSFALRPNGDLVVGGTFATAGGGAANNIARWNGSAWFPLGNGVAVGFLLIPSVNALATLSNGDLVAAGTFSNAGTITAANIARWNGTTWSGLGPGWANGSAVGGSRVGALLLLGNGDLLAAGSAASLGTAGPLVQRWNGTTWTTLSGVNGASGTNDSGAFVTTLALLPDGDVLAGGYSLSVAGGAPPNPLLRWSGASWSTVPNASGFSSGVARLHVDGAGVVRASGAFVGIGGIVSAYLATFVSACPATVAGNGVGCSGSAGPTQLASTALPWIGSSWRALATGMPANAFALRVLGLSALATPIPLSAILPQGGAGCTLYVTPDLVDVFLPLGPSVATELAIPDSLALVGIAVHQQVTPLVFTAVGLVEYTATNALIATIGAL